MKRRTRPRYLTTYSGDGRRRHPVRSHRWQQLSEWVPSKGGLQYRRCCVRCGRQQVTADGRPLAVRRPRWGLTRRVPLWWCAIAWTVSLGLCAASALSVPIAPAVHV